MGKSTKKQKQKAFKIFEGNAAAIEALREAFKKGSYSGRKISNKEIGNLARAGATREQLYKLADRVESSSGRLRIGSGVDIDSYFPEANQPDSGLGDNTGPVVEPTIPEYEPTIPAYEPQQFDTTPFDNQIATLNTTIGTLTSGFNTQIGSLENQIREERESAATNFSKLQTQLQEERKAAAAQMKELQGSFAQAISQQGRSPRVEGIRFADRGTGGATQQQLQRRGLKGTFGRRGDRLMKISSLNV